MQVTLSALMALLTIMVSAQDDARQDSTPYLTHARRCANWLDSAAIKSDLGTSWPVKPDDSPRASEILYSGTSGIVLFYLRMYRATGEQHYLKQASSGGDWLCARAAQFDDQTNPAFWTGIAGVGYVLDALHQETREPKFNTAAHNCYNLVKATAKEFGNGGRKCVRWNEVTDIIGGSAGIGFYLLHQNRKPGVTDALDLAIQAGDGLIADASDVDVGEGRTGLKWMMSPSFPREMPNYSHGTAGICDFLLALDVACREAATRAEYDGRFLVAAVRGAGYLESLAVGSEGGLIPHNFPDGADLFYLGWCHGPSGTVRFLDRLHAVTKDVRWKQLSDRLTTRLLSSKIPDHRPPGFWENAGLCCGNAGAASFLLHRFTKTKSDRELGLAKALSDDLLRRATEVKIEEGTIGLKWIQAEHRVRPELLEAQTGLMQGASGIGMWFLNMHNFESGKEIQPDLPLFPF